MPYRDEKEALRARLEELERTISHIDTRSRELDELRQDEPDLRRQRDELRAKLRDLEGGHRTLPVLDGVQVASPCGEKWDEMVGDEASRFCLKCEKNVYDLSSMTREQAETLIVAKEGKLCVRFYRRADGTILTADCPEGVARKRRRRVAAGMVGAGLLAAGAMGAGMTVATQGEMAPPAAPKTAAHEITGAREVTGQMLDNGQRGTPRGRVEMGGTGRMPPPRVIMGHVSRAPAPPSRAAGAGNAAGDPLPFTPPAKR